MKAFVRKRWVTCISYGHIHAVMWHTMSICCSPSFSPPAENEPGWDILIPLRPVFFPLSYLVKAVVYGLYIFCVEKITRVWSNCSSDLRALLSFLTLRSCLHISLQWNLMNLLLHRDALGKPGQRRYLLLLLSRLYNSGSHLASDDSPVAFLYSHQKIMSVLEPWHYETWTPCSLAVMCKIMSCWIRFYA